MAPTRPSIMSEGAMMSAPASTCTSAWRTSTCDGEVIMHIAVADQPVMAVAGIGIERHVAQDADLGTAFLMARTLRQTRLLALMASRPSSLLSEDRWRETARSPECPAEQPAPLQPRPDPTIAGRRPASKRPVRASARPRSGRWARSGRRATIVFSATSRRVQSRRRKAAHAGCGIGAMVSFCGLDEPVIPPVSCQFIRGGASPRLVMARIAVNLAACTRPSPISCSRRRARSASSRSIGPRP